MPPAAWLVVRGSPLWCRLGWRPPQIPRPPRLGRGVVLAQEHQGEQGTLVRWKLAAALTLAGDDEHGDPSRMLMVIRAHSANRPAGTTAPSRSDMTGSRSSPGSLIGSQVSAISDSLAQRRSGHVQPTGRRREAQLLGNRNEIAQMQHLHPVTFASIRQSVPRRRHTRPRPRRPPGRRDPQRDRRPHRPSTARPHRLDQLRAAPSRRLSTAGDRQRACTCRLTRRHGKLVCAWHLAPHGRRLVAEQESTPMLLRPGVDSRPCIMTHRLNERRTSVKTFSRLPREAEAERPSHPPLLPESAGQAGGASLRHASHGGCRETGRAHAAAPEKPGKLQLRAPC